MMRLLLKVSILIVFGFWGSSPLFSQITVSGSPPNRIPNRNDYAKMHYDSSSKVMFKFKNPKWYYQGELIRAGVPSDSTYFVSGVGIITISFTDAALWNTNTNCFWYFKNGAWGNSRLHVLDSLFAGNNTWTGKNTFTDSLKADKGIKSGGLIDTKGLNSEGSATKAAATLNGVQADRDTVVATNFTLNGSYGTVGFDCTGSAKNCQFPDVASTINWRFIIRKDDEIGNDLILKNSSGTEFYRLKSRMTVVFKNVNGTWKRQL